MKDFMEPEMMVVNAELEDVITTSDPNIGGDTDEEW